MLILSCVAVADFAAAVSNVMNNPSSQQIYFKFRDFLKTKADPCSSVPEITAFSRKHVSRDDDQFLVVMFKWLELESLIDDVHKKINSLLLEAEEGEGEQEQEQEQSQHQEQSQQQEQGQEREQECERIDEGDYEVKGGAEDEIGGLVDDDEEQEAQDKGDGHEEVLHWIEQYDPESGYNFYYNDLTHETQWQPPADSAYVPVSLDAMGYEMVEEGAGGENADWEWDEEGGKWVFKGETGAGSEEQRQEQESEPDVLKLKSAKVRSGDEKSGEERSDELREACFRHFDVHSRYFSEHGALLNTQSFLATRFARR
jgi:hypothetical protein